MSLDLAYSDLTESIIGAAIKVHRTLGPGLLESAYEACMARELDLRHIGHMRQMQVPIEYEGVLLDCGYRLDLLVADTVVVEIKAVEKVHDVHLAQLMTYMRLLKKPVGLLLNFNVPALKDGVYRRVL